MHCGLGLSPYHRNLRKHGGTCFVKPTLVMHWRLDSGTTSEAAREAEAEIAKPKRQPEKETIRSRCLTNRAPSSRRIRSW